MGKYEGKGWNGMAKGKGRKGKMRKRRGRGEE
jgi:hypothetical protein